MKRRDGAELMLLGALWGASFLFMRMSAAEFGAVALAFVRVAGAGLMLLPLLLARRGGSAALREHWRPILLLGVVNSAAPFVLFMLASLVLSAGLMSVFNATAPMWTALIAAVWFGERLGASRLLGLMLGLCGVVGLSWGQADLRPGAHGISPALGIAACLAATVLYGVAANHARRRLAAVPPLAVAAGSQIGAAAALLLPAWWWWPAAMPGAAAWGAAAALALACTGLAYLLYFRLIASVGPSQAISVTFLIPGFAMLWGWVFLGEQPSVAMLAGCAVILAGTALSTGLVRWPRAQPA